MLSLDGEPVSPVEERTRTGTGSSINSLSSLTFGATQRSRENSASSIEELNLDLLNIEKTTDVLELSNVLASIQSSCRSVSINLIHVQEELKNSIAATTSETAESLDQHSTNLSIKASIVTASVKAATMLTSHHVVIKTKLKELEALSSKIQSLKIVAARIEKHIVDLTGSKEV
tara:strand:+ start:298 stop:819 length:522 start_codon:yes stop_codon:yes gene_type:complete